MKRAMGGFIVLCTLIGCATYTDWRPTIDPRGSNQETVSRDLVECKQLAEQAAGGTAQEAGTGAMVGGLLGAATGAAVGAAAGDPGTGAAVGAAAGGLGGGAYKGLSAEERYKEAYKKCMERRGHVVVG